MTTQNIAIERGEMNKLNLSTMDDIVGERFDAFREFDVILTIS